MDLTTKKEIINKIETAWKSLRQEFFKNTEFQNETELTKSYNYHQGSAIRKYGAEPYLQASFLSELKKVFPSSDYKIAVEARFEAKDKIADIAVWRRNVDNDSPLVIIELKVTGSYFWRRESRMPAYKDDLIRYKANKHLHNGDSLFVSCCYYESNANEIEQLIKEHSFIHNYFDDVKLSNKFRSNIVEAYAFIGSNVDWKVFSP